MIQRYRRCQHCGVRYIWTASGYGCNNPFNSETYCEGCQETVTLPIAKALSEIPKLFKMKMRDTKDIPKLAGYSLDELLEVERRQEEENRSKLVARRVYTPLFDLKTGDSGSTREIRYEGHKFIVTTWGQRADYEIKVEQEWDLQKQEWTNSPW